jgi:hypothetical protein
MHLSYLKLLACLVILPALAAPVSASCGHAADYPPGLSVRGGQLYLQGKPFQGIGMNYFSAFFRKLGIEGTEAQLDDRSYLEGFQTLRDYDIPFIRFSAGGFFPREWQAYFDDKEAYFAAFDQLVADAEANGLGLIPSLFWFYATVPDLMGEPLQSWGDPASQTHVFMRQYTLEVVERYKDSPAIWAWEFGNEWIHDADLPQPELGRGWIVPHYGTPEERTAADKMFRSDIYIAYAAFAQTVRTVDASRPIFSGDTMPRPTAYHNARELIWKMDSREQWRTIFLRDNVAMDGLSAHLYFFDKDERPRDAGYIGADPDQQIAFMMEIADSVGKPLWLGEFGTKVPYGKPDLEREHFEQLLESIVTHKVPLSALWNFDYEHEDQVNWNITIDNHRAYMLESVRAANKRLQGE